MPEGRKVVSQIAQFELDYTFWMNLASITIVVVMVFLRRRHRESRQHYGDHEHDAMDHGGGFSPKRVIAYLCIGILACGFAAYGITTLR